MAERTTKSVRQGRRKHIAARAFTLIETMTAVTILAFISASVWVVIDRCMTAAADSTQRMRAFEIARENMEILLSAESVEEKTEFGISDKFPDIQWRTTVESFNEPIGSRMWVQAVCSADYTDTAGEVKTVELTHWLTGLTKEQEEQLNARKQQEEQLIAEHIIETIEEAAAYAGVDIGTVEQWAAGGMPKTETGYYLKPWLIVYYDTDGKPTALDKQGVLDQYPELASAGTRGKTTEGSQLQRGGQGPGTQQKPLRPEDLPPDMEIPPEILKDL